MDIATSLSFPRPAESVAAPSAGRVASVRNSSAGIAPLVGKLRGINGNSVLARRFREIATMIADDLGGPDKLSEPTKILVRQAATLTLRIEAQQSRVVGGEDVDDEELVRLSNVLGRTLQRLGLKREPAKREASLLSRLAEGAR
jgi:hypothetical protein